jgi:excisionase family DNA binding protein
MLLNITEAAQYLGLKVYTVRKLTRDKDIPHRFLAGKYLYLKAELDEWLKRKQIDKRNRD